MNISVEHQTVYQCIVVFIHCVIKLITIPAIINTHHCSSEYLKGETINNYNNTNYSEYRTLSLKTYRRTIKVNAFYAFMLIEALRTIRAARTHMIYTTRWLGDMVKQLNICFLNERIILDLSTTIKLEIWDGTKNFYKVNWLNPSSDRGLVASRNTTLHCCRPQTCEVLGWKTQLPTTMQQ